MSCQLSLLLGPNILLFYRFCVVVLKKSFLQVLLRSTFFLRKCGGRTRIRSVLETNCRPWGITYPSWIGTTQFIQLCSPPSRHFLHYALHALPHLRRRWSIPDPPLLPCRSVDMQGELACPSLPFPLTTAISFSVLV